MHTQGWVHTGARGAILKWESSTPATLASPAEPSRRKTPECWPLRLFWALFCLLPCFVVTTTVCSLRLPHASPITLVGPEWKSNDLTAGPPWQQKPGDKRIKSVRFCKGPKWNSFSHREPMLRFPPTTQNFLPSFLRVKVGKPHSCWCWESSASSVIAFNKSAQNVAQMQKKHLH